MISAIKRNPWLFELLAIALVAYFLAKMTTNLIAVKLTTPASVAAKPVREVESAKKDDSSPVDYQAIVERNIFDSENKDAAVEGAEAADTAYTETSSVPTGEAVETSLAIELLSTFAVGEGKDTRSSATLKGKEIGPDGDVFKVGESFMQGAQLTQILHDRVIFANKGRLEYVLLNDFVASKGSSKSSATKTTASSETRASKADEGGAEGTKFTIQKSEIDAAMGNLDQLFTQIRAVPYTKDGKASGMKLLSVKPDSIFSKLGLKRGDVLQKINGKELNIQEGLSLFNTLKDETHLSLDILRRGKAQTMEYDVK